MSKVYIFKPIIDGCDTDGDEVFIKAPSFREAQLQLSALRYQFGPLGSKVNYYTFREAYPDLSGWSREEWNKMLDQACELCYMTIPDLFEGFRPQPSTPILGSKYFEEYYKRWKRYHASASTPIPVEVIK